LFLLLDLLTLVCAVAALQLIVRLKHSALGIRLEADEQQRGFEVLPIVSAVPIEARRTDEK
jgi:hypothetical protein